MSAPVQNLVRPNTLRAVLLFLAVVLGTAAGLAKAQGVILNGSVTVVESPHEPEAVRRATDDLLSDFAKVFGQAPRRVQRLEDAGPVAVLIAAQDKVPVGIQCAATQAIEAFAFSVTSVKTGGASKQVVCLTGADARGTIYAIYQFSQAYLGVDPMYLWTDKAPTRRASITLPADLTHVFPSPVFRYRGFFPNDEDQLTGWIRASKGEHSGISLKVWDNIFETILRLKGNMVVPGSWIFPDDAQVSAASRRGLTVNQHHASPLGVNAARWPKDVPYNLSTHPEILERAWKNAVATYQPDDQMLWSVGLRGLSDQAYASLDTTVRNNDALLGQRISEAMAKQMAIVRARFPNAHFIANLWDEGIELQHKGYLKIPDEVTQVWADTGYGDMQDAGRLTLGQGMYFHVAMQNGEANQLSEMVPVSVIQEELGRYIKAKATGFFLLNTSDIRAVAMTTQAAMEIAWGGLPKSKKENADTDWYRQWAAEQFGERAADAVAQVYKDYFSAPIPVKDDENDASQKLTQVRREYGEQHYFTEATLLILNALSGGQVYRPIGQAPKWAAPRSIAPIKPDALPARLVKDIQETDAAQLRWDHVWEQALAAEELVEPSRRDYYQAQVLTMIALNREGNRMLNHLAKAMQHQLLGQSQAETEMAAALAPFEVMHKYMTGAEYGKWKHWYRGDWLTNVSRTQTYVNSYANYLQDPFAPLPAPMLWNDWEAYFHIMQYQGDRTVDVH